MRSVIDTRVSGIYRELDATIEKLVPAVESLLRRIAPDAEVTSEPDELGRRVLVPVRFPDGIGQGAVVALLFRYRETIRVDLEIEHNRTFARANGYPSARRCFLNDFVATVTLPKGANALPADFERNVLTGVESALEAVQRHNREHEQPWNQIRVAA